MKKQRRTLDANRVVRDIKASWSSTTGLTVETTGSLIASS
jgi:hypothetical protein